jgi:hypothetical protein
MEEHIVRETLTYTTRQITEIDKAVSAEFNKGVMEAIHWSRKFMRDGPNTARLAIVQTYLRSAAKLSTVDQKAELEVSRRAFLDAFSQMTIPEAPETPETFPHGELTAPALPLPALDQDDEVGDTEVRSRLHRP